MNSKTLTPLLAAVLLATPAWAVTVNSFNPPLGSPGDQVTINGTGFAAGPVIVTFNGIQDPTAQPTSDTFISAIVPTGATNGPIGVSVNSGPFSYSAQNFTVIGPGPYVTNFSPYVGSAGTTVFIQGVHFTSATNAYFAGKAGANFFPQSENQIQVDAPAGVSSGAISVRSPDGTFVSSNFFVAPTLTGFSPGSGRANTNVTLTGTNLLGATNVLFNGVAVTIGNQATNNSSLVVGVPVGASTGPVRVNTPAGSSTSTANFVVQPTIFSFAPGAGPVGTSIVISGANFNVGTPVIRFNGVASTNVSGVSFGQLTAVVPAGATTGPISITTTDGSHTNSANFFLPPSITSFAPTNSAPGTTVTITGQNLLGATNVSFNGASTNFTSPVNNTTLQAVVPTNVTTGPISVTTPAGTAISTGFFYAAPVITGFAPTHGLPGTNVTITGNNFLGATAVKFNGLSASFTPPNNNTNLQAVVPTNAQSGPISVVAPAGTGLSTNPFVLDYNSDLALSVSAAPNPVFVGSNLLYRVVITNSGLLAAPNVVFTDTLPASVTLKSTTISQGTLSTGGNPITANFGSLAVGATANLTLTVAPQTAGSITNTANVSSDFTDPVPANNSGSISTTVLPLPLLSVRVLLPNRVQISWPVALSNYGLQSRATLLPNTSWSDVSTVPTVSGNQNVLVQTNSAATTFYRLRSQ